MFTKDVDWLWKAMMMLMGDGEKRLARERAMRNPRFGGRNIFFAVSERMNSTNNRD